ncbi:MAG: cardiolipin synthase [Robinsoniella sp.]|nr:cardiolipin synthase [Robinsoniella sp.]
MSSTEQSKQAQKEFANARQRIQPYWRNSKCMERLKETDRDAYAQAHYLHEVTGMFCYSGGNVTYYKIGEEFHQALLENLECAQKFIFMEYFIIQDGVMWASVHEILKKKAAQGIAVYLMYDDFGCMATLPERYYRQMEKEGIHCIPANKFTPVLSNIHNNRDHRKITVIDGKVGFTGGINLADEYINAVSKYGHWKDTAVKLEGEAVKNLTALFWLYWNMQTQKPMEYEFAWYIDNVLCDEKGEGAVMPYGDGPKTFYPESIGKNVYLNMINDAKKYLYITTPYLICDHELMNALRLAAKKGVDVRIITPHIPDKKAIFLMTRSSYERLITDGVKIYEYTPGFIHAKNFICDDKFATCGTINLDYRSLVHHYECSVWMYHVDCIKDMKEDFEETMKQSEQIEKTGAKLKGWEKILAEVMKVFSPLL